MPRVCKELTALEVKKLPFGATKALGGVRGLYIRKTSTHGGAYFLRYRFGGKSHDFNLGLYPGMSLSRARALARDVRELVDEGIDPIADKVAREEEARRRDAEEDMAAHPVTFFMVAEEWLEARAVADHWKNNPRGEKTTRAVLARHIYPKIGNMPVEDIRPKDVFSCLQPIWQKNNVTARKAKSYMGKIFKWAMANGKRLDQNNPASMDGALGVLLEPLKNGISASKNLAACSVAELPQLMKEIHSSGTMAAVALEFSILTAARSQAVRLATWDEIDLERGIWTIPLDHDKVKAPGRDRTIYLSSRAVSLLKSLPSLAYAKEGSGIVFANAFGDPMSSMTVEMFLKRLHERKLGRDGIGWIDPVKSKLEGHPCPISPHGTSRATFRTWAKDDVLGNNRLFDQEAVELCLLHSKNDGFNGAYDRARLEKERRGIMEAWGEYACSQIQAREASED